MCFFNEVGNLTYGSQNTRMETGHFTSWIFTHNVQAGSFKYQIIMATTPPPLHIKEKFKKSTSDTSCCNVLIISTLPGIFISTERPHLQHSCSYVRVPHPGLRLTRVYLHFHNNTCNSHKSRFWNLLTRVVTFEKENPIERMIVASGDESD